MDTSWLLKGKPPYGYGNTDGSHRLWWAVIRQSAHDLRFAHKSVALDALEFLKETGLWLTQDMFGIPEEEYKHEVARIVLARNRGLKSTQQLGIGLLSSLPGIAYPSL